MSTFAERDNNAYFSLSHKRREERLDPHIWDSCPQAALDLRVPEP